MNVGVRMIMVVYYETIKGDLKIKPISECRSDERLKTKSEESTRLSDTTWIGELEHIKIKTRWIDEKFPSVMGECVTVMPCTSARELHVQMCSEFTAQVHVQWKKIEIFFWSLFVPLSPLSVTLPSWGQNYFFSPSKKANPLGKSTLKNTEKT